MIKSVFKWNFNLQFQRKNIVVYIRNRTLDLPTSISRLRTGFFLKPTSDLDHEAADDKICIFQFHLHFKIRIVLELLLLFQHFVEKKKKKY